MTDRQNCLSTQTDVEPKMKQSKDSDTNVTHNVPSADGAHSKSYIVHLDAIRSLAALVVVASHAQMLFFGNHQKLLSTVPSTASAGAHVPAAIKPQGLGHHAVIVFFVLSGFLVGHSAWRAISSNRWSWNNYLLQRLTRLWIVLIPALVIGCCLDHIGLFEHTHSLSKSTIVQDGLHPALSGSLSIQTLLGNTFFLQTIKVPTYGSNAALWSLANEFWYYMAFPLLLLAVSKYTPTWRKLGYGVLAASLLVLLTLGNIQIALLFLVWLLGFGVSLLTLKIAPRFQATFTVVSLLQFLAVNVVIRTHPVTMFATDFWLSLSFALLLYAVLHARQPVRSLSYQHIAAWFSKFSYTVYLVHLPFLTFITGLIINPWHVWPKDALHVSAFFVMIATAYLYSWLLYLLFEKNTDHLRLLIRGSSSQKLWLHERLDSILRAVRVGNPG